MVVQRHWGSRAVSARREVGTRQDGVIAYSSESLRPSIVPWKHVVHGGAVPSPPEVPGGSPLCRASQRVPPRNEKSNPPKRVVRSAC